MTLIQEISRHSLSRHFQIDIVVLEKHTTHYLSKYAPFLRCEFGRLHVYEEEARSSTYVNQ